MKKVMVFLIVILFLGVVFVGYYLISPLFNNIELNDETPLINDEINNGSLKGDVSSEIVAIGDFKLSAHEVKGSALVIDSSQGKILRFENFETINGPDLRIYLSSDLGNEDFIDLGEIKATKGNVNYDIPEGVDLEKYNKVLVWCVSFKVLFSYAELE